MSSQSVLITGGAGYIGSHAVYAFLEAGWKPVVIDDLSTGHAAALPPSVPLVKASLAETDTLHAVIKQYGCQTVVHFAGSIVVPESVEKPLLYYYNNSALTRSLLEVCVAGNVRRFLFSSTAAVYGQPTEIPISEETPSCPINPYGASKLVSEWMVRDVAQAHGLGYGILRYFNVAGADPSGRTGQRSATATHLIKVAAQAVCGKRPDLCIFGEDYPTPDGTCIRDYIHVTDLADAHVRVVDYLTAGGGNLVLNCGYGHGASVRQVVDTVLRVSGKPLTVLAAPRRAGDPPCLVAKTDKIRSILGWTPRYDSLDFIVRSALDWENSLRN